VRLDGLVEEPAEHRGRQEADDHADREFQARGIAAEQALEHLADALAVQTEHG